MKRHCLHNKPSVKKIMWDENYPAEKNAWDESFTAPESWSQNGLTLAYLFLNLLLATRSLSEICKKRYYETTLFT